MGIFLAPHRVEESTFILATHYGRPIVAGNGEAPALPPTGSRGFCVSVMTGNEKSPNYDGPRLNACVVGAALIAFVLVLLVWLHR